MRDGKTEGKQSKKRKSLLWGGLGPDAPFEWDAHLQTQAQEPRRPIPAGSDDAVSAKLHPAAACSRAPTMFDTRQRPWRTLYLAYSAVTTVLFRAPFWLLIALPRPLRQRPSWTVKRSVYVRLLSYLIHVSTRYDLPHPPALFDS
jgi:hypothetical protein